MAIIKVEVELISPIPAVKMFKALADFDSIVLKVEPETFKSIDIIEGDGGVGTIRKTTFTEGLPYTWSKHRIDSIDIDNLCVTYTIFEGDILMGIVDSSTHKLKFAPTSDGGSVFTHTVEYHCKGDATLSEEIQNLAKAAYTKTFKGIEAYVIANPDAY